MSDWRMKGVVDQFGGIEWILFGDGGLARPVAVIADWEVSRLLAGMEEQRAELDALRFKPEPAALATQQPLDVGFDCRACGHRHQGRRYAFICIGCDCRKTSPALDAVGRRP